MPLELGFDLGCRWFGGHYQKSILIFDSEQYRYQKYLSDIAGQDIQHHDGIPLLAVLRVRHWLRAASNIPLRGGTAIYQRYERFTNELPAVCEELQLDVRDLSFADLSYTVAVWLRMNET